MALRVGVLVAVFAFLVVAFIAAIDVVVRLGLLGAMLATLIVGLVALNRRSAVRVGWGLTALALVVVGIGALVAYLSQVHGIGSFDPGGDAGLGWVGVIVYGVGYSLPLIWIGVLIATAVVAVGRAVDRSSRS